MSERKHPARGEPAWISIRYGFLVILIGGLVVSGIQLVMGSAPDWNSTGPAFIIVGGIGVAGSLIAPLIARRSK